MATWNSRGLRGSVLEEFVNRTNEKYLDRLVKEQDKKEEIDTISGATISSSSLKDTIKKVLEVYNEG